LLRVRAKPRASRSRLVSVTEQHLEIQLAAPPVDGAANKALIEFVSEWLTVSKSRVEIKKGEASRYKLVLVLDLSADHVKKACSGL
jgi:uncharacterized protein